MRLIDMKSLLLAVENGIIDSNTIQTALEMNRRESILNRHDSRIWKGSDGKYYTYIGTGRKGRKLVKRKTRKDLEDFLVDMLTEEQKESNETFKNVFYAWSKKKVEYGEIKIQTYNRYEYCFYSFFDEVKDELISNVDEFWLEDFIKTTIHNRELTARSYANMRTLIIGMFKYAKKKGMTDIVISQFLEELDLSRKIFKRRIFNDEESVFSNAEIELIKNYIYSHRKSVIGLAVILAFQTGMRSGEIVALQPKHIRDGKIRVEQVEERYRDENGNHIYSIVDGAKTETGVRNIIITESAKRTLKDIQRLNPFGEYLITEPDGRRAKAPSLTRKLYKICKALGIKKRSINKARKTYASTLIDNGVSETLVTRQMGHTEIATTEKYYHFNRESDTEKSLQLERAIKF